MDTYSRTEHRVDDRSSAHAYNAAQPQMPPFHSSYVDQSAIIVLPSHQKTTNRREWLPRLKAHRFGNSAKASSIRVCSVLDFQIGISHQLTHSIRCQASTHRPYTMNEVPDFSLLISCKRPTDVLMLIPIPEASKPQIETAERTTAESTKAGTVIQSYQELPHHL